MTTKYPSIEPEAAGTTDPGPVLKRLDSIAQEAEYVLAAIRKWYADGVAYRDVAILYPSKRIGRTDDPAMGALVQSRTPAGADRTYPTGRS